MPLVPTLATKQQLMEYLGINEAALLPENEEHLRKRASELIWTVITLKYDENKDEMVEAAKLATCAQVEHFISMDESYDIMGPVRSVSLSKFSVQFREGGAKSLAPRAMRLLFLGGLLYRGVDIK